MKLASTYIDSQTITLDGEAAFEELYSRLARWCREIISCQQAADIARADWLIERSVSLLGYMDRLIDMSHNYDVATRILSLHRFAIRTMINAKIKTDGSQLLGMPEVFEELREIFAAIRSTLRPRRSD